MQFARRPRAVVPIVIAVVAALTGTVARADGGVASRARLGRCVSFVKRLQEKGRGTGIVRPDLYEGLSGWIAMKARIGVGDVDTLAAGAVPDASACEEVGLAPAPLLALDRAVAKLQGESLRSTAESCLAALRVLGGLSGKESVTGVQAEQTKAVGRLLGYVAKEKRPNPSAIEARAVALGREAGAEPWGSPPFVQAIQSCQPLGVDVDLLRRTHGAS